MFLSGRPLLANPADAQYLVPRPEADAIVRYAAAHLNSLLLAQRGMGKTTVLRHVATRMPSESSRAPVYLDGRRLPGAVTVLRAVRDAVQGARDPMTQGFEDTARLMQPMPVELRSDEALRLVRDLRDTAKAQGACILLDDPDPETAHQLFGRLRDELWETGIVWVVAADIARRQEYLTPPADAFFERVLELQPLTEAQQHDLIRRRLAPADDIGLTRVTTESGSPRALLSALREAVTTDGVEATLARRAERQLLAEKRIGPLGSMMLAEIEDGATASASDADWRDRFGVSRQRAQQVLAQLEREGLVRAERLPGPSGRPRKVYRRAEAAS
jgi:hypothetical protein